MINTYDDLLRHVEQHYGFDVVLQIASPFNIRAVFDTGAAEYNCMSVSERLEWVELVIGYGVTLGEICRAFCEIMGRHGYEEGYAVDTFMCGLHEVVVPLLQRRSPLHKLAEAGE